MGGYTSARLLAGRPDVYAAAVSNAPGYDPYSSVLYECYLGLPQERAGRAVYDAANLLDRAPAITKPLMIACGTSDHATWTDAVKMSEELIRAGVVHEFVVLPEHYHGYDLVHDRYYYRKLAAFFRRAPQHPTAGVARQGRCAEPSGPSRAGPDSHTSERASPQLIPAPGTDWVRARAPARRRRP